MNSQKLLVTGPPGSGKSRYVLGQFDAAAREFGPDAALMVLPTYGEVEHAKRLAITRRGDGPDVRGLLDVSYATFTSLRERIAPGFRVRALPSRHQRDRLAARALAESASPVFAAVLDRPGFRSRFLRLVKELKQTGLAPASLLARARAGASALTDGPRERLEAFLDAWERYEALLLGAGTPDHEDSLAALVEELSRPDAGIGDIRCLVVDGFDDFSGVETRLLLAAGAAVARHGGTVLVTMPFDGARADLYPATVAFRARLLGREGYAEHRLTGFHRSADPALVSLAARLFADAAASAIAIPVGHSTQSAVRAIVGADPVDEWDRIGRQILALVRTGDGIGFRDVGVIVRRLDAVESIARRAFESLGIPVRLVGGGESLATEAVVRAVRGPLRLLAGEDGQDDRDFDAHAILEYLRWRALDSGRPVDLAAVDAADHRWRTEHLPASWKRLREDIRVHALETLLPTIDWIEGVRAAIEATADPLSLLEAFLADALPLRSTSMLDAAGRPSDTEADARLSRARAAKRRLLASIVEARSTPSGAGAPPTVTERIDDLLTGARDQTCEPSDRRLDAVSVLDAEEARHWELPVVFVSGLVEKSFPLHPREDLFLRDEDRAALAARLDHDGSGDPVPWRTARDAETGERRLFLTALTRARTRLYLTRSARDANGREIAPSFFWRDVAHALGWPADGDDRFGANPPDLERASPPLVEVANVSDLRRYVAASLARGTLEMAAGIASAPDIGPWLARARRFVRPRADPLPESATRAFVAATRILSPTDVQAGFDCPHRFFLSKVARVPSDDAPLRGTTADRRHFGNWIHAAFELAVKDPALSDAEVIAGVLAVRARDIPDDADRAWYVEDLARILALFRLREEAAAASGFKPTARDVEIAFGEKGHEVTLGFGAGKFLLRGRIDRLDTDSGPGPRRAIVVDYKTSTSNTSSSAAGLRRVEDLQLALYARAIERPRGVTVVGLEHYAGASPVRVATIDERAEAAFVFRREGKAAKSLPTAEFREGLVEKAERRASATVETIRRGADGGHAKTPLTRDKCDRCNWVDVCRPDPGQAPLVAHHADDALLDASSGDDDDDGDSS